MKLWIVVWIAGHVAASVGPLPYGEKECHERIKIMVEEHVDRVFAEAARHQRKLPFLDGKPIRRDQITDACVWAKDRPR